MIDRSLIIRRLSYVVIIHVFQTIIFRAVVKVRTLGANFKWPKSIYFDLNAIAGHLFESCYIYLQPMRLLPFVILPILM